MPRKKEDIVKAGENTRFTSENQPENPGRKKKLPEIDDLLAEVLGEDPADPERQSEAKSVLKKLIEVANKGNVQAQIAVLDRAYGKPKQAVEHSGPDKGPINIKTWVIDVDGSDTE